MEEEKPFVQLVNVNKIYEDGYHAVHDFNIDIKKKEFIVFVGPSGCGKSTTIRMIAGLEDIASGELYIDGVLSNATLSKDRDIAMVFQNYALYPNLTVYNNMAFSLQLRRVPKEEIDKRVKEAAKILELTDYLQRKPKNLSGGQRQRVALGRAIVRNARIFLMDEPLSNLDAKLRVQMRSEIIKIHKAVNATTIYVTHDQTEAMTMADRIVVMKDGYIQQIGKPREIYKQPVNKFVARFIGSPSMNFIPVTYKHSNSVYFPEGNEFKLRKEFKSKFEELLENILDDLNNEMVTIRETDIPPVNAKFFKKKKIEALEAEKQAKIDEHQAKIDEVKAALDGGETHLTLGIRPESLMVSRKPVEGAFKVNVTLSELLGDEYYAHFEFEGHNMLVKISSEEELDIGDELYITLKEDNVYLFDDFQDKRIFY